MRPGRSTSARSRSRRRSSAPTTRRWRPRCPTSPSCIGPRGVSSRRSSCTAGRWRCARRRLGPDHPETAQSLNNLAVAHFENGDSRAAEQLYKRSIAIKEAALGPEHPELALTLNNLAELYRTQRRFEEAEPLFNRALAIDQKVVGPTIRAWRSG